MWFDSWYDVLRIALVGPAAYAAVVVFLRLSGKRTLAKLNAFDLVVTVALGSTLATILLSGDVSYAEGAFGLALLIALQYIVATLNQHVLAFRNLSRSEPTVVVRRGELLQDILDRERLGVAEVHQALRQSGVAEVRDAAAVVLETDGSLSVLKEVPPGASAMREVANWERQGSTRDR